MAEENKLEFSFDLIDNVSEKARSMGDATESAGASIEGYSEKADEASSKSDALTSKLSQTQMSAVTQMAVLGTLGGAVTGITNGLTNLGLVSDGTAEQLTKVASAFNLIKGTAQGLVAVKTLMATLNAQTAINAALTSYLAVLKNPAMMAGVALAGGAALGVAGALLMTNNNSTTTNNSTSIQITDTSTAKNASAEIVKVVSGGAL